MSDSFPLSPTGENRRAEILQHAQAEARHRRRRRQSARAAIAGVGVILLTLLLTHRRVPPKPAAPMVIVPAPATRPVAVVTPPSVVATRPAHHPIVIQFIQTEPNLAQRMAAPPQEPTWRRLSDDELIQALADAGHPAGLGWVGGREFILYRPAGGGGEGHSHNGKSAPLR